MKMNRTQGAKIKIIQEIKRWQIYIYIYIYKCFTFCLFFLMLSYKLRLFGYNDVWIVAPRPPINLYNALSIAYNKKSQEEFS